jgi:hypothetical protein
LPTGTTAVTQTAGNNTTALATTAFVTENNNVKVWVNFNGSGTIAIRSSKNVSSITDIGVGTFTVNYTTAISADAAAASMVSDDGLTLRGMNLQGTSTNNTTTSYKLNAFTTSNAQVDPTMVSLIVFR